MRCSTPTYTHGTRSGCVGRNRPEPNWSTDGVDHSTQRPTLLKTIRTQLVQFAQHNSVRRCLQNQLCSGCPKVQRRSVQSRQCNDTGSRKMVANNPHYLLFCESQASELGYTSESAVGGRWHFVLEQVGNGSCLEAADFEASATTDRLALLSVVRGLEALEQPSTVTLVTTSRYVSRGMRFGLNSWRDTEYKWERFGVRMPVRNADLWRRIDTAMHFHGVTCRLINAHQSKARATTPVPATELLSAGLENREIAPKPQEALEPVFSITLPETKPANGRLALTRTNAQIGSRSRHLFQEFWWKLAQQWIKWWRGRLQIRPAFYGT